MATNTKTTKTAKNSRTTLKGGNNVKKNATETTAALAVKEQAFDEALEVSPSNNSVPRALVGAGGSRIQEILHENLGGAPLSIGDLTRLKVPSGGTTMFEMPSAVAGKSKYVESFDGVIVAHTMGKTFWAKSLNDGGGGTPPDCKSNDMIHGHGDPRHPNADFTQLSKDSEGWLCASCPNNAFGSANRGTGEGKACKDLRFIFVLVGNSVLPKMLIVPPTSLKAFKNYFLGLADEETPFYGVVTNFSLVEDVNASKIKFARIVPSATAELSAEEAAKAKSYAALLRPLLAQTAATVASTDINS